MAILGWVPTEAELRIIQTVIQAVGLLGLAGAAIKFAYDRSREKKLRQSELAWRKTEFLLQLAREFDQSETYHKVLEPLELPDRDLHAVCTAEYEQLTDRQQELFFHFDRYLDFFDRLYGFVFTTEVLSLDEAVVFSGHIELVDDDEVVRAFAIKRGYSGVVLLSRAFKAHLKEWKASKELRRLVPDADNVDSVDKDDRSPA